jgi:hypothetical protein
MKYKVTVTISPCNKSSVITDAECAESFKEMVENYHSKALLREIAEGFVTVDSCIVERMDDGSVV